MCECVDADILDRLVRMPLLDSGVTVVVGAQWGDEGKGKLVDLLAEEADLVCRCQVRAQTRAPECGELRGSRRPVRHAAILWRGVVFLRRAGTMPVTRLSLETGRTTFIFSLGEGSSCTYVRTYVQQLEASMTPLDTR